MPPLLAALGILGVVVAGSVVPARASDPASKEATAGRDIRHGELEILNVTATPSVDALTFRGTARNPYDQPVDGIRLIMQVRGDPSPDAPEIARAQKVLDARLGTGEHTAFEIAVKVDPTTLSQPGLLLRAFAIQRGGEVLPRTPIWRD